MKYLLDTHVFLWCLSDPNMLSPDARNIIEDGRNSIFLSAGSLWEISIKKSLKKLNAPDNLLQIIQEKDFSLLNITGKHAVNVEYLPHFHGDPFDRLLIVQAQSEGLTVISQDRKFHKYDVPLVEA